MKHTLFVKLFAASALLFSLSACEDDDEEVMQNQSNIMVVHASPNAPAVDLYVDNNKVNAAALAYPGNTGYLKVNAGTRNFKVNVSGTNTTVINADVPVEANNNYSMFAYDSVSKIKPIVVMDNLAAPASGKAHLRFFHLSPNAPAVTVGVLSGTAFTPVFSNRSFETQATATVNQGFTPVDAGSYNFDVRLAANNTSVLTLNNIQLQAGKIYTVFAKGIVGNASTPLGAEIIAHN